MTTAEATRSTSSSRMIWAGRIISALPCLLLAFSAAMKFSGSQEVVSMFTGKFGYPASTLAVIGAIEILVVVVYLIPRTSFIGAVLTSAYMGGAVATHVRVGDPFVVPILVGVFFWVGLALRNERVRSLVLSARR